MSLRDRYQASSEDIIAFKNFLGLQKAEMGVHLKTSLGEITTDLYRSKCNSRTALKYSQDIGNNC